MAKITDVELKEMAKLQGWPHDMAIELLTAREHIPAVNAECKRLHEENLQLKASLREYVDMQVRMIDEMRAMRAEIERLTSKTPLLTVETEQETDGRWIAYVGELPGVTVYGETREDAIKTAKKLTANVIHDRLEHGESPFGEG